jgi:DNA-binding MarR family transcriptional regulator
MVSKSKTTQLATHVYRPLSKSAADIIKLLQTKKEASYKELADELGIDPSSIGKHIRKLQDEGFINKV